MLAATIVLPADVKSKLEIPPEGQPAEAFEGLLSPWVRRFLSLDPSEYLEKVACPVLALVGETDLQVLPEENLAQIQQTLERAGHRHGTLNELSALNHNFQTAKTGSPSEYFLSEETMAPVALKIMSDWMKSLPLSWVPSRWMANRSEPKRPPRCCFGGRRHMGG